MRTSFAFVSSAVLLLACGGSSPAPASPSDAVGGATPTSTTETTAREATAGGACAEIDARCDPYEDGGGLAKECHDLAEGPSADEATCAARRDECLKACPEKR